MLTEDKSFKSVDNFFATCNNIAKQHGSVNDDMAVILGIIIQKIKVGGVLGPTSACWWTCKVNQGFVDSLDETVKGHC